MPDLFISSFFLFITITIPLLTGFIFINFIYPKWTDIKNIFLYPFLGLAIIILSLQNLVYLDLPIEITGIPILAIILLFFLVIILKGRNNIGREWLYIILGVSIISLVNGVGYFRETFRWYIGYGWIDQYNYTITADFLKEYPFSTNFEDINKPYIIEAIAKKQDRIGQSIYHAFISSVTFSPADYLYGAVSLYAPILTFFAFSYIFFLLQIKRVLSYIFSVGAAIIPATSVIHLENFLSQALGTPFLIVTIAHLSSLNVQKISPRDILISSLLIATTNSIYTEYTPFILLSIALKIILTLASRKKFIKLMLVSFIILVCSILLNPFYFQGTLKIFQRTNLSGILTHVYPFNHTVYGYNRLYFGDLDKSNNLYFHYFLIFTLLLSISGLITFSIKSKNTLSLIILGFAGGPLFLDILLKNYPYQTYKLMLSFIPLLLVGIAYLLNIFSQINKNRSSALISILISIVIIITPLYATLKLANMSFLGGDRSIKPLVNSQDHRIIYNKLYHSRNENLYLNANHPYELARMAYYGRYNNLWFLNPILGDLDTRSIPNFNYTDLSKIPVNVVKIDGIISFPQSNNEKKIYGIIDGSIEGIKGNLWTWLGKEMDMKIYSQEEQNIIIRFGAYRGPANKSNKRTLRITNTTTDESQEISFIDSNPNVSFKFRVLAGYNNFKLETVFPKEVEFIPDNDKRTFMISLGNLTIY